MAEKKSLLGQLNTKEVLQSGDTPFAKKERTKTLRVKESTYDLVNLISFKTGKTKNVVTDEIMDEGIRSLKLKEKYQE
ncbi:hypothetical protein [Liquorilactobacillus vini]|uniref:hypothetical protein n=1 Tax=Liquorilactobacillus vini TaxID=238015 RepID=UPI0002D2A051|nr:hypothetical protein [Liquorilactobacillus vini]